MGKSGFEKIWTDIDFEMKVLDLLRTRRISPAVQDINGFSMLEIGRVVKIKVTVWLTVDA